MKRLRTLSVGLAAMTLSIVIAQPINNQLGYINAKEFDVQWISNQHILSVNREAGHATMIPYSSKQALLADKSYKQPWLTPEKAMTINLNGKWRFRYVPGSNKGPGLSEFQAENYNDSRWNLIQVPLN